SHLSIMFGLVEICSELVDLVSEEEAPGFRDAWLQYCRLYLGTPEEQVAELGREHGGARSSKRPRGFFATPPTRSARATPPTAPGRRSSPEASGCAATASASGSTRRRSWHRSTTPPRCGPTTPPRAASRPCSAWR